MNDSFLEDLGLLPPTNTKSNTIPVDRHITTRTATSTPLHQLHSPKGDTLNQKIEQPTFSEKQSVLKEYSIRETKKILEQDAKKQQTKVRISEKRDKIASDTKLKPIENKVKSDEKEIKDDIRTKIRETKVRIAESKTASKDRMRRSGSCKESNQAWDMCAKENRPSDGSKGSSSQVEIAKEKAKSHESSNKSDVKGINPDALLDAIKDIVSTHTKQESSKILRFMQELHFHSQANLIKNILVQTDEITNEIRPSKESSTVRSLMEQNERLKEDIVFLQKQNAELQKKLEELDHLKQENLTLKLKCKELFK
ncbi:uncharacterized protein LOC117225379 [Megalopta genalis]|uniref:uncharacterized protein LOC117225379 n=1 Tax=Megalopta genalis TaxID=115081 RepID=UPI003FD6BBFA